MMITPQILIFAILIATMALLLWGRFRHETLAQLLDDCLAAWLLDGIPHE